MMLPPTLFADGVTLEPTQDGVIVHLDLEGKSDNMELSVLGAGGGKIRTLLKGSLEAGSHSFIWDGKSDDGMQQPLGPHAVEVRGKGLLYREGFMALNHSVASQKKVLRKSRTQLTPSSLP